MFDAKELEKALRMSQERETIRVINEDGTEKECRAKIWTICGLDNETSSEITWGKVCLVGGMDAIGDAIMHMAQLTCAAKELAKAVMETVPGMTQKKMEKLLSHAVGVLEKRHEEKKNA